MDIEQLENANKLREKGIISEDEFNSIKKEYLTQNSSVHSNISNNIIKFVLPSIGFVILLVCFSQEYNSIPPLIDNIIDEELLEFSNQPYYHCFRQDVKEHIQQNLNLSQREIEALNFNGQGNTDLMAIRMNIMSRVMNIMTERMRNSPCIPRWQ